MVSRQQNLMNTCLGIWQLQRAKFLFIDLWLIFIHLRLAKREFQSIAVNFIYTFVGTLFIQMWSIFIHLRVIYTIVVDFHTFEGSFIDLWAFMHLRVVKSMLHGLMTCVMMHIAIRHDIGKTQKSWFDRCRCIIILIAVL